ncbi:aspartoacylase [Vibrio sp. NH-7]
MAQLNQVLLVAGTHGNELSGVYLQKLINERLFDANRTTFSSSSVIANPEAVKRNVRYVDTDLNRCFSDRAQTMPLDLHEHGVAQQWIENLDTTANQLVIDLHNTTSNMGATLILLSQDPFYTHMGAYVKQRMPEANILFEDRKTWQEQPYLCTAGKYGIMIEVGAQAHGALKSDVLENMKKMLSFVLDYLEKYNLGQLDSLSNYDAYFYTEEVTIPLGQDGLRSALVHPTICGRDFNVVKPGEPLLTTLSGYDICWEKDHDIYPHFINESAYASSHVAMALAEKKTIVVK